jgi:hypothetical protein
VRWATIVGSSDSRSGTFATIAWKNFVDEM